MRTHGHCGRGSSTTTAEYFIWQQMKNRCLNPKCKRYPLYGGRGIGICERWLKFENFFADMGKRPVKRSLERKNNDLGYDPDNCKWATQTEQMRNTRRNVMITHEGKTQHLQAWCNELGLSHATLGRYHRRGMSIRDVIELRGTCSA